MKARFGTLALALGLLATAGFGPAASSVDAQGLLPDVSFCLILNGGAYSSLPVQLYRWDWAGGRWAADRAGRTAANGCGTFRDVVPNTYYIVGANLSYQTNGATFAYTGWTPYRYIANTNTTYHVGVGRVTFGRAN